MTVIRYIRKDAERKGEGATRGFRKNPFFAFRPENVRHRGDPSNGGREFSKIWGRARYSARVPGARAIFGADGLRVIGRTFARSKKQVNCLEQESWTR